MEGREVVEVPEERGGEEDADGEEEEVPEERGGEEDADGEEEVLRRRGERRRGERRRGERRRSRWWLGHQLPGSDHGCKATGPLLVGSWWTCPRGAASC